MTDKLSAIIVGMGKMGKIRYRSLSESGGFNIVGVCDVDESNLSGYKNVYSDWKDCISKNKPDVVVVCTYNKYIPDIVCFALENGANVLSEKPPGRTTADAERMRECAHRTGKVLKFGFNHRYHYSVIEAKTIIDNKLLGEPIAARGVYGKAGSAAFASEWRNDPELSGGGILLDQGIHMLDLLCYFFGEFSVVGASEVGRLAWEGISTEDNAFAILKSGEGKLVSIHSSATQWKHKFDLGIICTNGYIELIGLSTATQSYGEERINYYRKNLDSKGEKVGNPVEHTICFSQDRSWDYETDELFNAVKFSRPVTNGTPDDAVRIMTLIDKIYNREMIANNDSFV